MKKLSMILLTSALILTTVPFLVRSEQSILSENGTAGISGTYLGDATSGEASRSMDCPPNSVFSQPPHDTLDSWSAATSDISPGYLVYDNFINAAGATDIRFWGINAANLAGWAPCSEDPMPFRIIFYTDAAGLPGTPVLTIDVTLPGVPTGQLFNGLFPLFEYNTPLGSPVPTGAAWVSIEGRGDPDCWFLWMSSKTGLDTYCYQWDGADFVERFYDQAFCLYGEEPEYEDFGDAPDPTYPTLLASNGARHTIVPGMFLGMLIDGEPDGQPTADALGDDNNPPGLDDEDGVVITSLVVPGTNVNVKVTASMPGFLDAWVDWNGDGDWADAGENVFAALALAPGVNIFGMAVPGGAATGITYSRWRYSSAGGLPFDGPANDGEVEDCRVFIQEPLEGEKWYQPPDLDNTGMDVNMRIFYEPDMDGLADDFLCTQSGPITDIHFWGSFENDVLPPQGLGSQTFELTFYTDIPEYEIAEWSMPGDSLWRMVFEPGQYEVTQITDNNPEDYYYPYQGAWLDDHHLNAYQYDFYIDVQDAFMQDSGAIYWLRINDITQPYGTYYFGWKTTELDARWNDDAVYYGLYPILWLELRYPANHEYTYESLDLAFALTMPAECDCTPGNANGDAATNILDVTYLISYLYKGGPAPIPYELCSGDANCDCAVNILDATYLISYLYKGGQPPCSCEEWLAICGPPLRK